MNDHKPLVIFFASLFISMNIAAADEEIYEAVDKDGKVEFSDKPTAGAQVIEVKPNVVQIEGVDTDEPSSQVAKPKTAGTTTSTMEQETIRQGVIGDERRRRELAEEKRRKTVRKESAGTTEHVGTDQAVKKRVHRSHRGK